MATIEPRLIHLLNGNEPQDQLPSIHSTLGGPSNPEDANALLLPPLELSHPESGVPNAASALGPTAQQQQQQPPPVQQQPGSISSTSAAFTLSGNHDDPHAVAPANSATIIGKRPRVLPNTEEHIHLPQPLKKQKSTQQVGSLVRHFPPIISGLHEPPPNAAVFPPIAAAEFDSGEAHSQLRRSRDLSASVAKATSSGNTGGPGGNYLYDGMLVAEPERLGELPSSSTMPSSAASVRMGGDTPSISTTLPGQAANNPSTPTRTLSVDGTATDPPAMSESSASALSKQKRKATKPRRRWTDEETNQLLIGVSRHGLGKWTAILEDREFSFSNRSAGDLKDRFRTCCPDELRGKLARGSGQRSTSHASTSSTGGPSTPATPASMGNRLKTKTSFSLENILIESDEQAGAYGQSQDAEASTSAAAPSDTPKSRKRRVHRRNMEDMVKLGIHGPFKKSDRRERRPFTEQDDFEILQGLQMYGPAWTKIHRHPSFGLSSRQPTDLRDRVRNKYPLTYATIEKGMCPSMPPQLEQAHDSASNANTVTGAAHGNTPMRTSRATAIPASDYHSLPRVGHDLRDNLPRRPHLSSGQGHNEAMDPNDPPSFDVNESSNQAFLGNMGEMGISRLLLDDPKPSNNTKSDSGELSWGSPASS